MADPPTIVLHLGATVCVCVCVAWKEIRNFFANNSICENKRAYAQYIRTAQQQQQQKNEKEMKWIEKIEKFYLLQVWLSLSSVPCHPLSLFPLQIVLLLCGKVEKGSCKLLQLQAEMEMAKISCCSRNGNEIKIHAEVCVPCRTV